MNLNFWRESPAEKRHRELLETLNKNQKLIMAKLNELEGKLAPVVSALEDVGNQLSKAKDEIIASLGNVEIPEAAMVKINRLGELATALKTASQALDDLNPDSPA